MKQLALIRVTKNTNVHDGLLREGDFILGPAQPLVCWLITLVRGTQTKWTAKQQPLMSLKTAVQVTSGSTSTKAVTCQVSRKAW